MVVRAAAMTTTTVGTAPLPKTIVVQQWQMVGPILGDLGITASQGKARTTDIIVANGQSKETYPRGGSHCATGVVNTLDCGDGRGIARATMTTTMITHE
jgi:hypothetical protein